jgi:hypothetical protein
MIPGVKALLGATLAWLVLLPLHLSGTEGRYEDPPRVEPGALLAPELAQSDDHRVESAVSDGFFYRFRIGTPSGEIEALGLEELAIRVREAHALALLAEESQGEVFAESAGDAVEGAVDSVRKVVEEPEDTAKGVAGGIGRWAKRTALGARKLANDVKESIDESESPEADAADADPPTTGAEGAGEEGSPSATGTVAKGVGKWVLGYGGARRRYAANLGVDPYSRNPVLAAELDRVAWAASAGSFGVGLAMPSIPITDDLQGAYGLVWERHPGDVQVRNRKLATDWGVEREARDRFFWNELFTPTEQTLFVEAVEALRGIPGRRRLIEEAGKVGELAEAQGWVRRVRLLARLRQDGVPLERIDADGLLAWALTDGGQLVVPCPADHLTWTSELARLAGAYKRRFVPSGGPRPLLAVSGTVSDRARHALAALGWDVRAR